MFYYNIGNNAGLLAPYQFGKPDPILDSINAARTIFPNCYFDREHTADGLACLRHYRYEVDPETGQFSRNPLHDHYSHGADAFRYIALMIKEPPKRKKSAQIAMASGWMG